MAQIRTKIDGEYTYPSDFTEIPDGGLLLAQNVNLDRESVVEPRRGRNTYKSIGASATEEIQSMFSFGGELRFHATDNILYRDSGVNGTSLGSFTAPSHGGAYIPKINGVEANQNFYFISSAGIQKQTSAASAVTLSGVDAGLDISATLTGASGFMATATAVAYRMVWTLTDANNNLILGAPSQRVVVSNSTGGTRDVALAFSIPANITVSNTYRIYRSGPTVGATVEPNDELQLVLEANPTAGQITAKVVTITDNVTDALRGEFLYTNSSQEGIAQANEVPPLAKDICLFNNMLFLSNTKQRQNYSLTLISCGAPGLQLADTIVIGGVTYTARAAENIAANEFQLFTGGSAAQNISDTAQSLVRVINRSTSNTTVYAYYDSNFDELPGQIFLQGRTLGVATFTVQSARTAAWSPNITSAQSSNADERRNRLYVSKLGIYEAFPTLQYFDIGPAANEILRIIPLREVLIVCKEEGFYRITGDTPQSIVVEAIDLTVKLVSPESAKPLANQIYCLTNQGVAAVSDTGVGIISRPIEDQITPLFTFGQSDLYNNVFAEAYETDRAYLLAVPESASATFPTKIHRFNVFTRKWTQWARDCKSLFVNPADNKLYQGDSDSNVVFQERKDGAYTDFSDEDVAVTIIDAFETTVTLDTYVNVTVGDALVQSPEPFSIITSINNDGTLTVDVARNWTLDPAVVKKAYECKVKWAPNFAGNPGIMKHVREAAFLFKELNFKFGVASYETDLKSTVDIDISGFPSFLWGYFAWGGVPWGGYDGLSKVRTYVPAEHQRNSWIQLGFETKQAFAQFALAANVLTFEANTERSQD